MSAVSFDDKSKVLGSIIFIEKIDIAHHILMSNCSDS
jgi:hypothetical protein